MTHASLQLPPVQTDADAPEGPSVALRDAEEARDRLTPPVEARGGTGGWVPLPPDPQATPGTEQPSRYRAPWASQVAPPRPESRLEPQPEPRRTPESAADGSAAARALAKGVQWNDIAGLIHPVADRAEGAPHPAGHAARTPAGAAADGVPSSDAVRQRPPARPQRRSAKQPAAKRPGAKALGRGIRREEIAGLITTVLGEAGGSPAGRAEQGPTGTERVQAPIPEVALRTPVAPSPDATPPTPVAPPQQAPAEAPAATRPDPARERGPITSPVRSRTAVEEAVEPGTRAGQVAALLFFAAVSAALYMGWTSRSEAYLTAESGLGYALGIAGSVMMLLLVLYPLRKKARFMRHLGPVKYWFRAHMIKGVIGPALILFHANFQAGSLNSNVALLTMLVVAISGLAGRYIYTKIHHGLYGKHATLKELQEGVTSAKGAFVTQFAFAPQIKRRLQAFETAVLVPRGLWGNALRLFTLGIRLRWTSFLLLQFLRAALSRRAVKAEWSIEELRRQRSDAKKYLNVYMDTVRAAAEFSFYERLFSFWHVLHFPLFLMLIVAGIVHVVAVHLY